MAVSETSVATHYDGMIEGLDQRLFERIPSQSSELDRRSLLSCQVAVRALIGNYTYLEIGSYIGGSLQPYLVDSMCDRIFSIDKRPAIQPDARGVDFAYQNNSTQRMLDNLKQVYAPGLAKITCIDDDGSNIDPALIAPKPHICFIDGEHTDEACFNDFLFCLKVVEKNGLLIFHDAPVVYNGLSRIVTYLEEQKVRFHAYNLPDTVFVIELNDFPIHDAPVIHDVLVNNHVGYLSSLRYNDHYREFANRPLFKMLRNLRVRARGTHVSK